MTPSKLEAADWALKTLPSALHPLIREARWRYQAGATADGLDPRELASFVRYVEDALDLRSGEAMCGPGVVGGRSV